jgi:hypothetical protein
VHLYRKARIRSPRPSPLPLRFVEAWLKPAGSKTPKRGAACKLA